MTNERKWIRDTKVETILRIQRVHTARRVRNRARARALALHRVSQPQLYDPIYQRIYSFITNNVYRDSPYLRASYYFSTSSSAPCLARRKFQYVSRRAHVASAYYARRARTRLNLARRRSCTSSPGSSSATSHLRVVALHAGNRDCDRDGRSRERRNLGDQTSARVSELERAVSRAYPSFFAQTQSCFVHTRYTGKQPERVVVLDSLT